MTFHRALYIISAGFFIMFLSSLTGYFWANPNPRKASLKNAPEVSEEKSEDLASEETSEDTGKLTPQNWKAFLRFEGKRKRMLGVNKNYNSVNMRTGPGTTYPIRETPQSGDLLMPIDRISNWFRARTQDGTIGWIHKSVVRQLKTPLPIYKQFRKKLPALKKSTKELIPDSYNQYNRIKVTKTKVNLRQGPGTQFAIAGRIYKHEEARLFGKKGDWYRVKTINGILGWVYSNLVKSILKNKPGKQKTIKIKISDPRMAPEFQFNQPGRIQEPIDAKLLGVQKPWGLVQIDENRMGWVHKSEVIQSHQSLIEQSSAPVRPLQTQPTQTDRPTTQPGTPSLSPDQE